MSHTRATYVIAILLFLFFCGLAEARYNMVGDERIYRFSDYRSKHRFPYTLHISIIEDSRPRWERGYISGIHFYTYDGLWSQSISVMMERILVKEFKQSRIFRDVVKGNKNTDLALKIKLYSFYGKVTMRKKSWLREFPFNYIYGQTRLNAILLSRDGKKVNMEKHYQRTISRKVGVLRNQYGHAATAAGRSFEKVVVELLKDVENSMTKRK
jgi:hypothetical protein